jgi:hypothetical protein
MEIFVISLDIFIFVTLIFDVIDTSSKYTLKPLATDYSSLVSIELIFQTESIVAAKLKTKWRKVFIL